LTRQIRCGLANPAKETVKQLIIALQSAPCRPFLHVRVEQALLAALRGPYNLATRWQRRVRLKKEMRALRLRALDHAHDFRRMYSS